jgi:hypothetical protein
MVSGPETNDVTNDQEPERRSEQGAQTAALPAGHNADMRTLVRCLPVESESSGKVSIDHSTVHRWDIKLLPALGKAFGPRKQEVGRS